MAENYLIKAASILSAAEKFAKLSESAANFAKAGQSAMRFANGSKSAETFLKVTSSTKALINSSWSTSKFLTLSEGELNYANSLLRKIETNSELDYSTKFNFNHPYLSFQSKYHEAPFSPDEYFKHYDIGKLLSEIEYRNLTVHSYHGSIYKKTFVECDTIGEKLKKENRRNKANKKEISAYFTSEAIDLIKNNQKGRHDFEHSLSSPRNVFVPPELLDIPLSEHRKKVIERLINGLLHFFLLEEEIRINNKLLSRVKAIKSLLNACYTRYLLNKRDVIRKMNSFFFKNLDDTHSLALISTGY